jgi:hypothetical protein
MSIPPSKRQTSLQSPVQGNKGKQKSDAHMSVQEEEEEDDIVLAQNYMRTKNYLKVNRCLMRCKSQKAIWLRTYSEFLVCLPPWLSGNYAQVR